MQPQHALPWYAALAATVVAICWGGNFSASKYAMMDFPPFLTILLRFVLLIAVLAPFMLRQKLPRWRDMFVLAFTNIILHFTLIFFAMNAGLNITSAIVATQLGVPFSCMLAAMVFKDYLGPWRSAGLAVAFVGVLIVAGSPNAAEHSVPFLLAVLGALAWAVANSYMKHMKPVSVRNFLFWPAVMALPMLLAMTYLFEGNHLEILHEAKTSSWLGVCYSTVFSSIVGYGLWNWLMGKYPLSQVVPFSLLAPIVGISCGVWLFGEPMSWRIIAGSALTIVGVGVIVLRRPRLAELEKI